jgi:hypothetical protein
MSWPYLLLAPCVGVVSWLWRLVPSRLALWVTWPPQEWHVVAAGHVEACPLPSNIRSLTLDSSFYVHRSKGGVGPRGACTLTRG